MSVEFYDVKNRKKVAVDEAQVKKTTYERTTNAGKTQVRYALKAELDGVKMTKFVNEALWNEMDVPVV